MSIELKYKYKVRLKQFWDNGSFACEPKSKGEPSRSPARSTFAQGVTLRPRGVAFTPGLYFMKQEKVISIGAAFFCGVSLAIIVVMIVKGL